jgi:hypothetical protein
MAELDIAAKVLLRTEPKAFLALALGRKIRSVKRDETEFQAIERRLDRLFRIVFEGDTKPSWVNVEIEAAWRSSVPRKTFDHWSFILRERSPLRSVVLVLRPGNRQAHPHGHFEIPGTLSFRFDVFCAWERLDARELIARRNVSLLPLVPFARGRTKGRVEEALEILAGEPGRRGVELTAVLSTFAEWVFPETSWLARMPKEVLMGTTVYRMGVADGAAAERLAIVSDQLRHRLGKTKRTDVLLKRLKRSSRATVKKVSLLVLAKEKKELLVALDRLLPETD